MGWTCFIQMIADCQSQGYAQCQNAIYEFFASILT